MPVNVRREPVSLDEGNDELPWVRVNCSVYTILNHSMCRFVAAQASADVGQNGVGERGFG